jgi:hypothetical protein
MKGEIETSMLETKTITKYYLDGEEISESNYEAIIKYIKRVCGNCPQSKASNSRLVETYTGSGSISY